MFLPEGDGYRDTVIHPLTSDTIWRILTNTHPPPNPYKNQRGEIKFKPRPTWNFQVGGQVVDFCPFQQQ